MMDNLQLVGMMRANNVYNFGVVCLSDYKIVHISDPHLSVQGAVPANHQRLDPEEKLRKVFDDVDKTDVHPDLIVLGGDLVHNGDEDAYRDFRRLLRQQQERFDAPIKAILGNHDRTDQFYMGYLDAKRPDIRYYYHESTNDYDFFFLDTKCGDIEQGYLDQRQLEWLDNQLQAATKPAIIFMHHPLYGPSLGNMKYSILQNGDELLKILDKHNVKAIFAGHVHFSTSYVVHGILNVVADSTAYHINCSNVREHTVSDATAYNVITLHHDDVGVDQRRLYLDNDVINTFKIPDADFVDRQVIAQAWEKVVSGRH
ncbi:Ser Thr phosphatase family protein [Lentilactobacillus parafarraginis DSM 18390 = JCM 14109]|jgi:3',5'-cyclic-nucleotide phosphodiesterase|uniref:Ser Thr phosphatase family protein n=2 Tax=Lentilactobacillus parafarraginis TaxID=390842 RepID=A0A0R1YPP9_9LACO|nr:Ser Thr phosphatase family protein [Lentilactobacillus parafarraginis DSM 18390 = JCM 14109]